MEETSKTASIRKNCLIFMRLGGKKVIRTATGKGREGKERDAHQRTEEKQQQRMSRKARLLSPSQGENPIAVRRGQGKSRAAYSFRKGKIGALMLVFVWKTPSVHLRRKSQESLESDPGGEKGKKNSLLPHKKTSH